MNEILRITGCGIRYSEITDGTPNTRFTAPGATPASAKQATRAATDPGVSSGPLRMIEQPAASAALIFRTACEADVVYANYGSPADFDKLKDMNVDVRGKIVIVRYGQNFRGVKAFEHRSAVLPE